MLLEISTDAKEHDIRVQIQDTILDSTTIQGCLATDFEFLEATGKNLCIP